MKRRYSNHHRARKYYRKSQQALRSWRSSQAWRYRELYEKYDTYAFYNDGVNSTFSFLGDRDRLIIYNHFDPRKVRSDLAVELRYSKTEPVHVELTTPGLVQTVHVGNTTIKLER